MEEDIKGKAKGGHARAKKLTPNERRQIARKAAIARWAATNRSGIPIAEYEGILELVPGFILECYVWKQNGKPKRAFHKRGLARNLGMKSGGGNVFMRTINRKGLGSEISTELRQKLDNPLILQKKSGDPIHTYDHTVMIDVCKAIWQAAKMGKLHYSQGFLVKHAEMIIIASAKLGLAALIDEATGYFKDKRKEEYRELWNEFIREQAREYASEFPDQFYDIIYRLYNLRRNPIVKNQHPKFFGGITNKYIYTPLAHSYGALLEILKEKNPVIYKNGGRRYKLFQFLSDVVGLPALRAHMWQIIGIGNASRSKESFDRAFKRAFPGPDRFLPGFEEFEDDF
jgi:hypothetical protein